MTPSKHRHYKLALRISLIALFAAIIAISLIALLITPGIWTDGDWASLLVSVLLSLYFFLLAVYINANAQRRAEAVANADLITSTGMLAMNSARSLSGSEAASLRVASDARAALQHYSSTEQSAPDMLTKSVIAAYNDLAFSTFLHSDYLARSVWRRLREGADAVVAEANKLVSANSQLETIVNHVGFVELLGCALRDAAGPDATVNKVIPLHAVWDTATLPLPRRREVSGSRVTETRNRLKRLETLYQDELTVMHDWEILHTNAYRLSCEIELVDITATRDWLAPWYVGQGADGSAGPVNVLGQNLDERARYDQLEVDDATPRWPDPQEHGKLPTGMRTTGIDNHCRLLKTQQSPTICVLAYELSTDVSTGASKRLVLDGNHRLAAARRLSLNPAPSSVTQDSPRPFRVLTFLIRELRPVDSLVGGGNPDMEPHKWRGFTPDIGLIRGTWTPDST